MVIQSPGKPASSACCVAGVVDLGNDISYVPIRLQHFAVTPLRFTKSFLMRWIAETKLAQLPYWRRTIACMIRKEVESGTKDGLAPDWLRESLPN